MGISVYFLGEVTNVLTPHGQSVTEGFHHSSILIAVGAIVLAALNIDVAAYGDGPVAVLFHTLIDEFGSLFNLFDAHTLTYFFSLFVVGRLKVCAEQVYEMACFWAHLNEAV